MDMLPALESLRAFLSPNPNLYYLLQAIRAYPRFEKGRTYWRWWKDGTGLELEVTDKHQFNIFKDKDWDKPIHWDLWSHASLPEVWDQSSLLLIQTKGTENFRLFFWGKDKMLRHFSWKKGRITKPSIFTYPIEDLIGIMLDLRYKSSNKHWVRDDITPLSWQKKYRNLYKSLTG